MARQRCIRHGRTGKGTPNPGVQKAASKRAKNSRKPKQATKRDDAAIKQRLIQDSIASYRGNCPCPYNKARDGSECGRRSAYSRPGGAAPLCYHTDVTDDMVRQ